MSSIADINRPLRATLHELGLCSKVPSQLADFYHRTLGYQFEPTAEGYRGTALDRRLTLQQGDSKSLSYAAYAVPDIEEVGALECRLQQADVAFTGMDKEGFERGAIVFADPDGNRFLFGVARKALLSTDCPNALRPARIQHVVFATMDINRLLTFYTEVLRFTLSDRVVDDEGSLRTAFVRCSNEHHSLAIFSANENRLDHFCHEAGDWNLIRDWADHLATQCVPLKWGPGRHGPGDNLFMFIHDPDGNWVEISAELETIEPDRPVGKWPHHEYTLNSWGMGMLRS